MKKQLVSVVMITYLHEHFIEQAINSVLMQECDFNVELIIVNDCSPDDTDDVVLNIIKNHPKAICIKYIRHEKNIGMMPNFNFALKESGGKYIAICEGDDYWTDPLKLQKQVEFLENNPEFIITSGNVIDVIEPSKETIKLPILEGEFSFEDLVKKSYISTLTVVFRNITFPDDYWKYATKIHAGDYPLYFMLLQYGKLKVFSEVFGCYRRHVNGVFSQKSFVKAHELAIQSNKIILKYHKLKGWKYKPFYASIGRSHYYCLENALELKNKKKVKKYLIGLLLKTPYNLAFSKKIILKSLIFLVFSKGKK